MIQELFVFLPTIVGITLSFCVGVAVGISLLGGVGLCLVWILLRIPEAKSYLSSFLSESPSKKILVPKKDGISSPTI